MTSYILNLPLGRVARTNRVLGRWLADRAAIRALHRLDDRMLADMGLNRSEIEHAAKGGRLHRNMT